MFDEALDQQRNIFTPFPQWRQIDRYDIQPIIKVLSEGPIFYHLFEIRTGGRDNTHVDLDGTVATNPLELPLLQYAQQFDLERNRHVADFIEENRAAIGLLESADPRRDRAGKCTFDVSKQFGFEKVFRDGAAINTNQLLIFTRAVEVNSLRDQFFAGACLTLDQY